MNFIDMKTKTIASYRLCFTCSNCKFV